MKYALIILAFFIGCAEPKEMIRYVRYKDTCATKIVNFQKYQTNNINVMFLQKRVFKNWVAENTSDSTAKITLKSDTALYSPDFDAYFIIRENGGWK